MRILLATDAWEPQVNGVVRTLARVTSELREMGDLVEVISPDQFATVPLPTYPEIKLAMGAFEKVQQRFKAFEPEAIHIATEGPIGLAARRICLEWKLPFTTSYHTRFPEYVSARLPLPLAAGYAYMKWFHRPSGRLMVATRTLADELQRRGFRNISQWSKGLDTEVCRPRRAGEPDVFAALERPVWLYVGRVAVEKNIEAFHPKRKGDADPYAGMARPIFLSVGRVAVEKNVEAFLALDLPGSKVVVGDGPQRAELAERYPDVLFTGAKLGEDLASHYACADVFVFPSLTDTFGLVMLEAWASGLPIAGFLAPGPADIIPGSNAGVLAPDQTNGLREACLAALEIDPSLARAAALRYSWRACAEEFRRLLQPYPEPEKSRFWRRLRRLTRLRRGQTADQPIAPQAASLPN